MTAGGQARRVNAAVPLSAIPLSRHPGESRDPAPLRFDWCSALDSGFRRNDDQCGEYPAPFVYLVILA
jgi:hypothetical protein